MPDDFCFSCLLDKLGQNKDQDYYREYGHYYSKNHCSVTSLVTINFGNECKDETNWSKNNAEDK